MNVIVVYKSRYGSTRGIAEFIAEKLREHGVQAEARSVDADPNPGEYDAVVIGSAVYMEHWMKEAAEFVRRNRTVLAERPVWLFSSGPLQLEQRARTTRNWSPRRSASSRRSSAPGTTASSSVRWTRAGSDSSTG